MDVDPKRGYIYISHIEGMWFQVKSTALGVRVPGVLDSLVPPTSCVTLGKLFNLFSLVPNFKMVMIFKVPHHLVFVMIKSVGVCKTPRLCGTCINHTMYGLCPHSHAWSVWISYVTWQKRLCSSNPGSVQFSRSVMSDCLRPHESQHARPPCPSPTPGVHSNSCPSSRWCHPAISSSVVPFSSCPQSLPASEPFPMSQIFAWGGQSTGVSALASFLPKKSQGWSPLEWTGWISL